MAYIIPENVREKWKTQARLAGMDYATVVGQHVYDLQGLIDVLKQQLEQTTNTLKTLLDNSPDYPANRAKNCRSQSKTRPYRTTTGSLSGRGRGRAKTRRHGNDTNKIVFR